VRNYGNDSEKFDHSRPAFQVTQGLLIGTDLDRSATHDFLLMNSTGP